MLDDRSSCRSRDGQPRLTGDGRGKEGRGETEADLFGSSQFGLDAGHANFARQPVGALVVLNEMVHEVSVGARVMAIDEVDEAVL